MIPDVILPLTTCQLTFPHLYDLADRSWPFFSSWRLLQGSTRIGRRRWGFSQVQNLEVGCWETRRKFWWMWDFSFRLELCFSYVSTGDFGQMAWAVWVYYHCQLIIWCLSLQSMLEYSFSISYQAQMISTIDPKAINRIVAHPSTYGTFRAAKYFLSALLGEGLLVVEGEQHRQQRRVMASET